MVNKEIGGSHMTTIGRVTTPTFSASLKVFGGEAAFGRGPIMLPHNLEGLTILNAEDTQVGQGIAAHTIKNPFKEKAVVTPITAEDVPKAVEEAQRIVTEPINVPKTQTIERPKERASLPVESLLMLVVARNLLPISSEIAVNLSQVATPQSVVEKTVLKTAGQLIFSRAQPESAPLQAVHAEEEEVEEKPGITQKVTKRPLRFLKDGVALRKRISEVREGFNMAKIEAKISGFGEKVKGFLITKFLQPNPENTSQIVQPDGPDGSYEQTRDEINAGTFNSEGELIDIVLKNNPVKIGVEGELATHEEVAKVTKYKLVKPQPVTQVVARIVKKQEQPVQLVPAVKFQKVEENTIEDLGLSEIFPKAA